MTKLFYAPNSIALAPHIALAESGLEYELDLIDHYGDKTTSDGRSYFELSPLGYVPALETADGAVLTESSAVLQYIADLAPSEDLCPAATSFDRYLVLQWVHFVATELHQKIMRGTIPGATPEYHAANLEQLKTRLKHLDQALDGRDFLVGSTFTIGDIFTFVAVRWWMGKVDMADYPNLARFMAETARRPGVLRALEEEGIE
jgi:glutathione S-transferase